MERLTRRPLGTPDGQAFSEHLAREQAHLRPFMAWIDDLLDYPEAMRDFLARGEERAQHDGLPWRGLWSERGLEGAILFFPLDRAIGATEITYWIGTDYAGRGLLSAHLSEVIDETFSTGEVRRIALQADVRNERSQALARRLGFTFEGIRRQAWKNGSEITDVASFSLLATDPRPARV